MLFHMHFIFLHVNFKELRVSKVNLQTSLKTSNSLPSRVWALKKMTQGPNHPVIPEIHVAHHSAFK